MQLYHKGLSDSSLILKFKEGDESAFASLLARYAPLVRSRINRVYTQSFDSDDLFQECMICFISCIVSYDESRGNSFSSYAQRAIDNCIVSAIRHDKTEKNKPLFDFVSISDCDNLPDKLSSLKQEEDPSLAYIKKEELELMESRAKILLSKLELKTLNLYLAGSSYDEIARELGISSKSVDNAMQRIRKKLSSSLNDNS